MEKNDFNLIPSNLKNGIITEKEAVNYIAVFVNKNFPIFGLHHYDEDFKDEIILAILEKGPLMISHYNENLGSFFNYFYCFVLSLIRTRNRTKAKKLICDSIVISESAQALEEKEYNYNNINYNYFDSPKIPYANSPISPNELRSIFSNIGKDKGILIIAIKSSFYITDDQIEKLCVHYKINKIDFYKTIQYFRNLLLSKYEKKKIIQDRRAKAYYNYKRYTKQLELINKSDFSNDKTIIKNMLLEKNTKQYLNWYKLNKKLKDGLITVRPSNKLIASVLGICERQVMYYIKSTKKKLDKKDNDICI